VIWLVALQIGCAPPAKHDQVESFASPAASGSAEPRLARGADGTTVLSWLEPDGEGVALRYSTLDGTGWSSPQTVARGDDWFVNWADFPSVVPIDGDLWAAHWLVRQSAGGYAYDVALALSTDRGRTWSPSIAPHTDGTAAEHGFVSLFSWQGRVGAVWLDGRDAAGGGHAPTSSAAGTQLRTVSISREATLDDAAALDGLACDCCQTDVAPGARGPVVVYRDRTPFEVRDIYAVRAVDGVWQPARPVAADGWVTAGCPVNGPAVAADGERVAVAWFTAADGVARVRIAWSQDGAASFGPAIDVDVDGALGRVDVALLDGGDAAVSYLRTVPGADGEAEVVMRRVSPEGAIGQAVPVARTGADRPSGFPQIVRAGAALVLAWTDTARVPTTVRTARVDAASLPD
jgi:hypothetical protein